MSQVLREQRDRVVPVLFSSHQLDLVERLCDRVGVVHRGRMAACGPVEQLRAGGPTRLVVDAPAAREGWTAGLPDVAAVSCEAGRTVLELVPGGDDQAVLAAALATGPVHEFRRRRPSLTELFRHLVGAESAA